MKKIISLLLVLLLALTSAFVVNAEGIKDIFGGTQARSALPSSTVSGTYAGVDWELTPAGVLTISKGSGTGEVADFSGDMYGNYSLNGVSNGGWRAYIRDVTSIVIANDITKIGVGSFIHCSSATSITLGSNVRTIGDNAFGGCSQVTSIVIPDNVETIGNNAFYHGESPSYYHSRDARDRSALTTIVIGSGVESIGDYAFGLCPNLESLTIRPGAKAVNGIDGMLLSSLTIPASVEYIGGFNACENLTTVTFAPSSNLETVVSAFNGCPYLSTVNLPASLETLSYCFKSDSASPSGLVSLDLSGTNVTLVDVGAENLHSLTLPSSVNEVYMPSGIAALTIPGGVSDLSLYIDSSNINNQAVYFGNNVTISNIQSYSDNVVFVGPANSALQTYCEENYLTFKASNSEYNVTLNANGGTFSNNSSTYTLNKTAGTPADLPIPTRTGYTFVGYGFASDTPINETVYYDTLYETSQSTLYAIWGHYNNTLAGLTVPGEGAEYVGDNSVVAGYTSSKIGDNNGISKTWIKQSAKWTGSEPGETAELRIDYAYSNDFTYTSRDVLIVYDGSLDYNGGDLYGVLTGMSVAALQTGLNNRVGIMGITTRLLKLHPFDTDDQSVIDFIRCGITYSEDGIAESAFEAAYDMLDRRADKSRMPILIWMTCHKIDDSGLDSGTQWISALKQMGCEIATVFYDPYEGHDFNNADFQAQAARISSDPSMIYEATDISSLSTALTSAFTDASSPAYSYTTKLDTGRFTTSATTATVYDENNTNCGTTTVSIQNNVINWNTAELDPDKNYYITVPLNFVQNAQPLPANQTPNGAHGEAQAGDYPVTLVGNDIANVHSTGSRANTVDTAVLPLGAPAQNDTYTVRYVNHQGNASATTYGEVANLADGASYSLPQTQSLTGFVDGVPVNGTNLFAGWFTNKNASQIGSLDPTNAASTTITIGSAADAADGATDGVITLYAGWVAPGSVTRDGSDPNTSVNYQSGFSLEGVQIKSKDVPDEGVESANWQGAQYNGMRFVTVYRNNLITELDALHATGNPNYLAANENGIRYGYMMYAKADIGSLTALNTNTSGAVDVDCTRDTNMNHKYFTNYRLSTVVVRYDSAEEQTQAVEARAYVDYRDANGFARRAFNTYTGSAFAGGCRATYNAAYTALTRVSAQ